MPRETTVSCDICFVDITAPGKRYRLVVGISYSRDSWEHRVNHANWSGEVCAHCHDLCGVGVAKLFDETFQAIRERVSTRRRADLPRARRRELAEGIFSRMFRRIVRRGVER